MVVKMEGYWNLFKASEEDWQKENLDLGDFMSKHGKLLQDVHLKVGLLNPGMLASQSEHLHDMLVDDIRSGTISDIDKHARSIEEVIKDFDDIERAVGNIDAQLAEARLEECTGTLERYSSTLGHTLGKVCEAFEYDSANFEKWLRAGNLKEIERARGFLGHTAIVYDELAKITRKRGIHQKNRALERQLKKYLKDLTEVYTIQ
jgi:hypothetical protein